MNKKEFFDTANTAKKGYFRAVFPDEILLQIFGILGCGLLYLIFALRDQQIFLLFLLPHLWILFFARTKAASVLLYLYAAFFIFHAEEIYWGMCLETTTADSEIVIRPFDWTVLWQSLIWQIIIGGSAFFYLRAITRVCRINCSGIILLKLWKLRKKEKAGECISEQDLDCGKILNWIPRIFLTASFAVIGLYLVSFLLPK